MIRLAYRITPFGHPGVKRYVLLSPAFRSLSRPSSPYGSQASTINLYSLDHIILSALHHSFLRTREAFYPSFLLLALAMQSVFPLVPAFTSGSSFPFLPLRFQTPSCLPRVPAGLTCVSLTGRGRKEITSKSTDLFVYCTHDTLSSPRDVCACKLVKNRGAIFISFS